MSIVIHTIKNKQYAYDHVRRGDKVITTYLYPVNILDKVNKKWRKRDAEHGGGRKT